MNRRPAGYIGRGHETIGSDILAVLDALTFPEAVLGDALVAELGRVRPTGWYPIQQLLELLELLDQRIGVAGLRKTGRALFKRSHEARVGAVANSARDIVHGIDGMYRHANRGIAVGGWKVLSFEPGRATLDKTTPHHCALEEGILDGALSFVGAPSTITQSQCFRQGADSCVFVISSRVTGAAWDGT